MNSPLVRLGALLAGASLSGAAQAAFPLLVDGAPVALAVAAEEPASVRRAAGDVAADIARVVGAQPALLGEFPGDGRPLIVAGTLGTGGLVDRLRAEGRFAADELEGAWESFVLERIEAPGGPILVVGGSDARGTIYGLYELSAEIGVSPWAWWADVPVAADPAAAIAVERRRFGPPAVKYRGIFINDEDWALKPWAARTFDPALGDIGPRTYGRVFELLLRLRANTLWPAMHKVSRPFNEDGQNAALAAAYGIVMSTSHAEPMLRNNVREWTAPHADYNFQTNRDGVVAYWEERLRTNGAYENIYTLGMRGIHDSGMQGGASVEERVALLEEIIGVQRDLLRRHVDPAVETIPQVFVAYKEVLELYRAGLEIPPDVTVVWPDDNFGYIRDFASPAEQAARPGSFGVYNHISYLGRPLAYLWLNTTPPALLWEEMAKAHAHGADRLWILNVGDIKPGEIGTEFFLRMAWDLAPWGPEAQPTFLRDWAEGTFGTALGDEIAAVLGEYYRLNFIRKPEHLQFFLPREEPALSDWSEPAIATRLGEFAALVARVEALEPRLDPAQRDAFFQLVAYPVKGSAAANERYFWTERFRREPSVEAATRAHAAEDRLQALTRFYNEDLAGGKWRHLMALEPADDDWRSMRIAPLELPPAPDTLEGVPARHRAGSSLEAWSWEVDAAAHTRARPAAGAAWTSVAGLGRSARAVTVLPFAGEPWADNARPALEYSVEIERAGAYRLTLELLPTFPLAAGGTLRLAVAVDGGPAQVVELERLVGSRPWSEGVLAGFVPLETTLELRAGRRVLRVEAVDRGVVLDRLRLVAR